MSNILEKINETLESLGSTTRWKKPPEDSEEYASLKEKAVLMIDDELILLEEFVSHLTVATGGNAFFILEDGNPESLFRQIAELKPVPNIILLDYVLSSGLTGKNVAEWIKEIFPSLHKKIVGFSSMDFDFGDGIPTIHKSSHDPSWSMIKLAKLIVEKND